MTDAERQEAARLQDERDWVAVDDEFGSRYVEAGMVTGLVADDFSLEWQWQVCWLPTVHWVWILMLF